MDVSHFDGGSLSFELSTEILDKVFWQCRQVECNDFCKSILRLRMSDKLLHAAEIHSNVETFDGSTSGAVGAGGGFPCQAWSRIFLAMQGMCVLYLSSVQDISQAGSQEGMAGARSSLVKHVFRVFDTLPGGQLRPMGRQSSSVASPLKHFSWP